MTTALRADWIGGALWVSGPRGALLVDAPAGVEVALAQRGLLPALRAVIVSSGRSRAVAGLVGLWEALDRAGVREVSVLHVLGDERTPLLAGAWSQGWPDGLRLRLDGCAPTTAGDAAGVDVEFVPLRVGDAASRGGVVPVAGCGVRLAGGAVTWVPTCRPGTAAQRLARGAGLAVVEVGVRPWPADATTWRLSEADAELVAGGARAAWLVGDDGERLAAPTPPH